MRQAEDGRVRVGCVTLLDMRPCCQLQFGTQSKGGRGASRPHILLNIHREVAPVCKRRELSVPVCGADDACGFGTEKRTHVQRGPQCFVY